MSILSDDDDPVGIEVCYFNTHNKKKKNILHLADREKY